MDEDFALALSLQLDDENEGLEILSSVNSPPSLDVGLGTKNYFDRTFNSASSAVHRPLSVVDESWELIDPIPNIRDLFLQFNDAYFDGKLAGVEVKWSPKMTLCAGVCSYEGRGGLCSIRLSEPLLKLRPRKDLVQTLLHEMIHALLFVTQNNKDHDSHGPEFHKHMYRINQQSGASVTVYHSFHDEVNNYRQHWWKCDGPCRFRPPFYGIVRRSMNRAPSKNDSWWHEHSMSCGGKFHKIKEPEDYGKKSSKRKRDKGVESGANIDNKSLSKSQDISKWFKPTQNSGKTIIKTINSFSSNEEQKVERQSVFSGNGRSLLVPGETSASISKDEWIKRLMQKQAKLSKGKEGCNALCEGELHSESETMERKVLSTVILRVDRDEKENLDVKNKQRGHKTFENKKGASLGEGLGLPHVSSSSKSPELSFKILSSTASSVRSPTISPLPVRPSSSTVTMNSSIPGGQSYGKKEKPDIVIIDSSPSRPILELVDCPACPKKIPVDSINMHLDQCLSRGV